MKNEYNKCPFCNSDTINLGGGLRIDEYYEPRQRFTCGAIFDNVYRLEYHGREIIIPPNKGGESDAN